METNCTILVCRCQSL